MPDTPESWLVKRGLTCARCGQCCIAVGRTFWQHGDFTDCPELEKLANETESRDEGLPCGMLQMVDGVASCRIETQYGRQFKPEVCRAYPDGVPCWYYGPGLPERVDGEMIEVPQGELIKVVARIHNPETGIGEAKA